MALPSIRRLVRRTVDAFDERTGLITFFGDLARHPVPPDAGWWYVFGSAVLVCFMMQVVTGIALATRYVGATGSAYQALNYITYRAVLGNLLRGMHFFGASAMILLVGIHMIQVFLMGCYKYPREVNWVTGVLLLFLTVAMGFSGQLLRWDQTAVWATVLAAEMIGRMPGFGKYLARFLLGGKTLSGATLSRFLAFHVFFLPAAIFAVVAVHLYLVFHDGISAPPVPGVLVDPKTYRAEYDELLEERGIPFWPDAAWRDVVVALAVVVTIMSLAYFVGPPALNKPSNPSLLASEPRPDWYMLWYFAVLALLPRGLESAFMILAPLSAFIFLLLVPIVWNEGERHPARRPWAIAIVALVVLTIVAFWIEGAISPWSPDFEARPLPAALVRSDNPKVIAGAQLFYDKGCEFCHTVQGHGGLRGPNLTDVALRLSVADITIRILNGGGNMPAFAGILTRQNLDDLVAFLESRVEATPTTASAEAKVKVPSGMAHITVPTPGQSTSTGLAP